jgi:hypothetical protein
MSRPPAIPLPSIERLSSKSASEAFEQNNHHSISFVDTSKSFAGELKKLRRSFVEQLENTFAGDFSLNGFPEVSVRPVPNARTTMAAEDKTAKKQNPPYSPDINPIEESFSTCELRLSVSHLECYLCLTSESIYTPTDYIPVLLPQLFITFLCNLLKEFPSKPSIL